MGAHHLDVLAVKRLRERRRGGERGDGEGGVAGESEDGTELGELPSEERPVLRCLMRFVVGEEGYHAALEQPLDGRKPLTSLEQLLRRRIDDYI